MSVKFEESFSNRTKTTVIVKAIRKIKMWKQFGHLFLLHIFFDIDQDDRALSLKIFQEAVL